MKRNVLAAAWVGACMLAFGYGTARGVELRQLTDGTATAEEAGEVTSATYEDGVVNLDAVDSLVDGEDSQARVVAPATDGTYTGTVGGKPFTLTVAGNKVTSWKIENFVCPTFTLTQASTSTTCNIAGNNSFTCGSLGCSTSGNSKITGSFSGNSVSGSYDADFQPSGHPCCSFRNLSFLATRNSTPAAPSNLTAVATSDTRIVLNWQDNSNNETEFRIEMRGGFNPSFTDIGAVSANATSVAVSGLDPSTLYDFRVRAHNASGYSGYSNIASATTFGGPTGPCVANATTLCLNNNRFQIRGTYDTGSQSGDGKVVELTSDTGYLWFFNSDNVEVVIKVINGCGFGGRYWVFAGGLTDVEVRITVTDTQTGGVRQYFNPRGTKFAPVQDTSAFATCP